VLEAGREVRIICFPHRGQVPELAAAKPLEDHCCPERRAPRTALNITRVCQLHALSFSIKDKSDFVSAQEALAFFG